MVRHIPCLLLVLATSVADSRSQPPAQKQARKTNDAEVRFADGSTVKMVVLQDSFELQTSYGKLTIPAHEVRRIDFAFRISDHDSKRVESAIRRLGDNAYEQRQAAFRELAELAELGYPALQAAVKSQDTEVSRRAQELINLIREKVPAEQLRFPAEDIVRTAKFTIAGRLTTPTLKAHSRYFSDGQVQLKDLRSVRWLVSGGEAVLTIDAALHGSADHQWLETEVVVGFQQRLLTAATGKVDLWPQEAGGYLSEPAGYQAGIGPRGFLPGTLIGRIGENGKPFALGDRYEGIPGEQGKLYLQVVPSPWNTPSTGTYRVTIGLAN